MIKTFFSYAALSILIAIISACASRNSDLAQKGPGEINQKGFFNGLSKNDKPQNVKRATTAPQSGVGVNGKLWRATLETLSFIPLKEVDPYGGGIITDWYTNPEVSEERFKLTVYILDTRLRADALSVQVFKQVFTENQNWRDATVNPGVNIEIENSILTRARQIRISEVE